MSLVVVMFGARRQVADAVAAADVFSDFLESRDQRAARLGEVGDAAR